MRYYEIIQMYIDQGPPLLQSFSASETSVLILEQISQRNMERQQSFISRRTNVLLNNAE